MSERRSDPPTFTVERKRRLPAGLSGEASNLRRLRPAGSDDRENEGGHEHNGALSADQIVAKLHELGDKARRMRPPMSNNPDAFHEDKSELGRDPDRLAEAIRIGPSRAARA